MERTQQLFGRVIDAVRAVERSMEEELETAINRFREAEERCNKALVEKGELQRQLREYETREWQH